MVPGERILIVEDERIIALDLKQRLERFGYTVSGIAHGDEDALEAVSEHSPDLVLMDIMLGNEMNGIEVADRISKQFGLPVVFLTAYADDDTIERVKSVRPAGYVLKPFKERELYTTIDIALYKSRIDRELRKQQLWFSASIESVEDGLIAADSTGLIRVMNPAAATFTGYSVDHAIGQPLKEVFELVDDTTGLPAEAIDPQTMAHEAETIYLENTRLRNSIGAELQIEGAVSPIHTDDGLDGVVVAFRDVTEIKRMSDTIDYQARHDSLTGLTNRDELFQKLKDAAEDSAARGTAHSFIYVDLDQFKVINDVCGHFAGDELLRQVARTITATVGESQVASRLGGDEFGVLLRHEGLRTGLQIAQQLLENIRRKFIWHMHAFNVTASLGLVPVDAVGADIYAVLAAADDACYLAKEEGGNGLKVYERTDTSFRRRRGEMQWISRLTTALERDNFRLYYQTIASTNDSEPNKTEILLRLRDSDGTMISPGTFIPAAERYKLMPHIDRWVITNTLEYAARQTALHGATELFCVNLSGPSIADDTFLDFVEEELSRNGSDPGCLCIEITETSAIENLTRALRFIRRLRGIGVSFALDDFGNGFSSFAYLKELPVDFLKIDGSFVHGAAENRVDRALVESVQSIGTVMGMKTIAEYVKDDAVLEVMRDIGVDFVQGYAISKPRPLPPLEDGSNTAG
jgi:diguanylate cyclase (GGDEF)-like protein/PAS domain S-box-containing protein